MYGSRGTRVLGRRDGDARRLRSEARFSSHHEDYYLAIANKYRTIFDLGAVIGTRRGMEKAS